jgi:flotillin
MLQTNVPSRHQAEIQPAQPVSVPMKFEVDANSFWSVGGIALAILGTGALFAILRTCLCICKPNEVVILAGRRWRTKDGGSVGYRILSGGRALRVPFLETVKRMDVTTMPVRIEVHNAYSKGGIPLHIQAIANIKISSDPTVVGNAIERFLDHKRQEITRVARETLEGNLRGVVATLTPEQVNEDRLKFAERIKSDVSRDLKQLGLHLDILKIQSVADEVDYLSSLGRSRIAMIIRDAEIAESDALAQAEQIEAECQEQAEVAITQDKITVLEQENYLRKIKARLEKEARSEEEITIAATQERRAKAEQVLQTVRSQVERFRLEADQVRPADARRQAEELRARGEAAVYSETATATALVNEMLAEVWSNLGAESSEVFVIQQLETILQTAVQIPERLKLKQVSVVDNGNGEAIAGLLKAYPQTLQHFLESVRQTLGIDVVGTLTQHPTRPVSHSSSVPSSSVPSSSVPSLS